MSMGNFDRAFSVVVGIEAGYVHDPNDPGGETKYGISKRSYPNVDIANLTVDGAKIIYLRDYWTTCACGQLPDPLALFVFDCAVNQGQGRARRILQDALGVPADGNIGPVTLAAAAKAGNYQTAVFMTTRAFLYMQDANFERYGHGWFNRLFIISLAAGV
jgi:lysozyme family protein